MKDGKITEAFRVEPAKIIEGEVYEETQLEDPPRYPQFLPPFALSGLTERFAGAVWRHEPAEGELLGECGKRSIRRGRTGGNANP